MKYFTLLMAFSCSGDEPKTTVYYLTAEPSASEQKTCKVYCKCPGTGEATWFTDWRCPLDKCYEKKSYGLNAKTKFGDDNWEEVREECN